MRTEALGDSIGERLATGSDNVLLVVTFAISCLHELVEHVVGLKRTGHDNSLKLLANFIVNKLTSRGQACLFLRLVPLEFGNLILIVGEMM